MASPPICDLARLGVGAGTWVSTPDTPARYRLHRDIQRNPLVKGWAFGMRRFWGTCDEGFPESFTRPNVQYRWEASECELSRFDSTRLCDHLLPRRQKGGQPDPPDMLFVGDSYTGQAFISFTSLMRGSLLRNEGEKRTVPTGSWMQVGKDAKGRRQFVAISELQADALACVDESSRGDHQRPPLQISFVRNEFLLTNEKSPGSAYHHAYPWLHRVTPTTILVLQVTAWFGWDADNVYNKIAAIVSKLTPVLKSWRKQVFLLSPSGGHPRCNVTTAMGVISPKAGPNATHLERADFMYSVGRNVSQTLGLTYLDVTSPLIDRSDGHMPSDCGHWCLPGPYDVVSDILFHALLVGTEGTKLGAKAATAGPRRAASPLRELMQSARGNAFNVAPLSPELANARAAGYVADSEAFASASVAARPRGASRGRGAQGGRATFARHDQAAAQRRASVPKSAKEAAPF